MESAVALPSPVTWSTSLYALDRGVGLAVCVEHRGVHCWYLDRCVPVGGRPAPSLGPFRPCTLHEGQHLYVRGFCISPGQRYAYRYGRCPEVGCLVEICNRLDVVSGRTERLDAETDRPHGHAAPVRVEFDEERLAAAIVAASRATRQERQVMSRPALPGASPASAPSGTAPAPEPAAPVIPTVTVWSPGPDDGPGT